MDGAPRNPRVVVVDHPSSSGSSRRTARWRRCPRRHCLFAGIPSRCPAVRYHSLAATRVPDDLVVTAHCQDAARGSVVMGVRHRTLPLHGVQFHPKSVLSEYGVRLFQNLLCGAP